MIEDHIKNMKYLLSRSDVKTALLYLDTCGFSTLSDYFLEFCEYIEKYWPSLFESYQKVYEDAGKIEAKNDWAIKTVQNESRYQMLREFLSKNSDLQRIYDYGASRCLYDIKLCNELGKQWYCVDIDPLSVSEARKLINQWVVFPDRMRVDVVGNDRNTELYDLCICMEVLEHVIDPVDLLNELARNVRDGGKFFITVPYGPMEYTMWKESPDRNREHIREFNEQMLKDLFGDKKDFELRFISYGRNKYLPIEMGCHVVTFTKDENIKFEYKVDLDEKLKDAIDVELPGFCLDRVEA